MSCMSCSMNSKYSNSSGYHLTYIIFCLREFLSKHWLKIMTNSTQNMSIYEVGLKTQTILWRKCKQRISYLVDQKWYYFNKRKIFSFYLGIVVFRCYLSRILTISEAFFCKAWKNADWNWKFKSLHFTVFLNISLFTLLFFLFLKYFYVNRNETLFRKKIERREEDQFIKRKIEKGLLWNVYFNFYLIIKYLHFELMTSSRRTDVTDFKVTFESLTVHVYLSWQITQRDISIRDSVKLNYSVTDL